MWLFLIIINLLIFVYQDFKYRAISIIGLLVFFVLAGLDKGDWVYFGINCLFIGIQMLLLSLYFSIKHGKIINITKTYLGIGDIFFFIPLCWLFSPHQFMLFFIISLCLVLIGFILIKIILNNIETIPLAGGMSIVLIGVLIMEELGHWDRYSLGLF